MSKRRLFSMGERKVFSPAPPRTMIVRSLILLAAAVVVVLLA